MTDYAKQMEMLADLLDLNAGLSNWEMEFVESLSHWDGLFTEKQGETLEKIWDEKAEAGLI